jgi:D-serine deaminase-like pyridoxal phosphate-dependent protein
MTRVVSKPTNELLCLDLGHKAVASEMGHPRVHFTDLEQVEFLTHSEEHLVIQTPNAANFEVGDVLYGIPTHICPTTALHQELVVVDDGEAVDLWKVFARDRRINI